MPERKERKKLRFLLKGFEEGWFKYEPKDDKPIDWIKYTQAQINEINNVLLLIRHVVDDVYSYVPELEKTGRPNKSACDRAKAILMQQFFQCSNRVAEGLVKLFKEKLRIIDKLSYKDIERAYEDPEVVLILHKAHELSNKPVSKEEKDFAIDGTGMPSSIKQNYANDKEKGTAMKGYEKLVAIFGEKYKLIGSCDIADAKDNESPYLQPLLDELMEVYEELNLFSGDPAYLSRDNCNAIESYGGIPRIYPKINSAINQRGSKAWTHMLLAFIADPQQWLEEYHIRSISESGNSVLKRRFPRPLLKRDEIRRKCEAFSRVCIYNFRQLNYIHYMHGNIFVEWLN